MEYNDNRINKRGLSDRQRKIRIFTALTIVIYTLFAFMFFWVANRTGIIPR